METHEPRSAVVKGCEWIT